MATEETGDLKACSLERLSLWFEICAWNWCFICRQHTRKWLVVFGSTWASPVHLFLLLGKSCSLPHTSQSFHTQSELGRQFYLQSLELGWILILSFSSIIVYKINILSIYIYVHVFRVAAVLQWKGPKLQCRKMREFYHCHPSLTPGKGCFASKSLGEPGTDHSLLSAIPLGNFFPYLVTVGL